MSPIERSYIGARLSQTRRCRSVAATPSVALRLGTLSILIAASACDLSSRHDTWHAARCWMSCTLLAAFSGSALVATDLTLLLSIVLSATIIDVMATANGQLPHGSG